MRFVLGLMGLAAACSGPNKFDNDTDFDCGFNAPTFETIDVTDIGMVTISGKETRALQVSTVASDEDGDLTTYTVKVWYDTVIDGKLGENSNTGVTAPVSDVRCGVPTVTAGAVIPLGGSVPLNTQVEFGLVVLDAAGNASNDGVPVLLEYETPEE